MLDTPLQNELYATEKSQNTYVGVFWAAEHDAAVRFRGNGNIHGENGLFSPNETGRTSLRNFFFRDTLSDAEFDAELGGMLRTAFARLNCG